MKRKQLFIEMSHYGGSLNVRSGGRVLGGAEEAPGLAAVLGTRELCHSGRIHGQVSC